MREQTLVVVGAEFAGRYPGFIILTDQVNLANGDNAGAKNCRTTVAPSGAHRNLETRCSSHEVSFRRNLAFAGASAKGSSQPVAAL
jgi:hypothetical protein